MNWGVSDLLVVFVCSAPASGSEERRANLLSRKLQSVYKKISILFIGCSLGVHKMVPWACEMCVEEMCTFQWFSTLRLSHCVRGEGSETWSMTRVGKCYVAAWLPRGQAEAKPLCQCTTDLVLVECARQWQKKIEIIRLKCRVVSLPWLIFPMKSIAKI